MYSFTTSGGNVIIKDISNPNPSNQFTIATIDSVSTEVAWSYTREQDRVRLYVNGTELTPAKFGTILIDGVHCVSKSDFISKITTCLPSSYHVNSGGGESLSQAIEWSNNLETKTFIFADSAETKSFVIPAGYAVRHITFESVSTQNVRIGDTANGEELMADEEISAGVVLDVVRSICSTRSASRTIYVNSSAADITATILYTRFFKP